MARTLAVLVTALTAALACAAPALGATPFTAATSGTGHDLAVGGDGRGHVAWRTDAADDTVTYCRVAAGGSACELTRSLNFPGTGSIALGQVQVFAPEANTVVIFAGCTQCTGTSERTFRWTSADNGSSFGGAVEVGDMRFGGEGSYIGGGNMLGVNGALFQAMSTTVAPLNLGGGAVFSPSTVRGGASEAIYASNDLSAVRFRVYNGALTPNTMNNEAVAPNWSGNLALSSPEPDNEETHLSSGGSGVLLSYVSSFSPSDVRVGLRVFNSTSDSFGAPVYVQGGSSVDDNGLDFPHHSQDAGSRIHMVWRTLHDGGRLRYIRSDDGGTSFTAPANLALGESFQDPLVEAGPAGTGFAAWRTTGGAIRVVVIDPQPEPSGSGGPGGPGGGDGGSDTSDPDVSGFGAADRTLVPGAGTEFTFRTNEAGQALLTFYKRVKGLKVRQRGRRRCVPRTRARLRRLRRRADSRAEFRRMVRRRRCKAWKKVGQIRREVLAGQNTIVWNGRVAGRRLRPGLYEARLTVRDAAGNVSSAERLRFRVVRRRR
jgi:hypothetical protein